MRRDIDFGSPAWRRHRELDASRALGALLLIAMGFCGGLMHVTGAF